ncbi:MAG: AAA family ATPase [Candidatus Margulisiibacteriota bacterium]
MLCDECKKNPASVHVTKIVNGRKIAKHLCSSCAAKLGFIPPEDMTFPGFFDFPDIFASVFKRRQSDRIFDYFSEDASHVITLASEEAKRLSHDHLRTEHILLGLLKQEGIAANVLKALGVDLVSLFSDVETLIGHGEKTPQEITLSPRAKKVLELSYNVARELGFNYVGPEHLLLGILREGESLAAQAIHKRKVNFDKAVREVLNEATKAQGEEAGGGEAQGPEEYGGEEEFPMEGMPGGGFFAFPGMQQMQAPPRKPALTSFGKDLTALARENKLDPVIGRQKEIDRVIRILSRRTKNNPALIGDPGVGKTAIVEGLANKIVKGEVPEIIKDKQVIALDLAGMVAGTKYRGEFEARVKKMLDEIISKSRQIILFIDELHTLVGAGGAEGAIDAANILKPALARGDLQVIGATTVDEYRKYVEKDPALERRFQPLLVAEPSVEETIEILKGVKDRYESHHHVKIPDAAIIAAATLSDRYITDRFLPDKAIDCIDEAAAKVRLRLLSPNQEVRTMQKELVKARKEKETALASQHYEQAAKVRDKIIEIEKQLKETEAQWKTEKGGGVAAVTEDDIAEVVSDWTGIPVIKLSEAETEKLVHMEETLHKRIIGQDDAISAISQAIRRGRAGLKPPDKPVGSFIFAGPTGVGKTEVARRLAEFMFGTQEALIRLDMSEYMEKHTVSRLIGAPPGYVGYEEGGRLTEAVRRKPYSVILFDEIEKAHPDIFNVLLQILDDGRLTDSKGRVVDFKNTIIIMTTNIGQSLIHGQGGPIGFISAKDEEATYEKMKDHVLDEAKTVFRPEFLNRVDEIIVFHPLTKEQLTRIVDILLSDVIKQIAGKNMSLAVDPAAKDIIVTTGYDPKFGARPLRRAIQQLIENPLSNQILEGKFKEGDGVLAKGLDGKIVFEKTQLDIKQTAPATEEKKSSTKKNKEEIKEEPETSGEQKGSGKKKTR